MYSTGNSTQYSDKLYGKRIWKRMDMCICMTELLCRAADYPNIIINYTSIKLKKKTMEELVKCAQHREGSG